DERRLAADGRHAGERLQRTNLVGLGLPERRAPWRGYDQGGTERARGGSIADQPTARDLAAVPEFLIVRLCLSHHQFLPSTTRSHAHAGSVRSMSGLPRSRFAPHKPKWRLARD